MSAVIVATIIVSASAVAKDDLAIDLLLAEARSLARLKERIDRSGAMASVAAFKTLPPPGRYGKADCQVAAGREYISVSGLPKHKKWAGRRSKNGGDAPQILA